VSKLNTYDSRKPSAPLDKDLIRELHATFFNEVLQSLNKKQKGFIEYSKAKERRLE
jgi:hypothetical protein